MTPARSKNDPTPDPVSRGTADSAPAAEFHDFEGFLTRLSERDRANVQKHLTACEAESSDEHLQLWKRLACALSNLAPKAIQTVGQRALRFYIADGKYRMQIFALEDLGDGSIIVYLRDSLDAAIRAGVLRGPVSEDGTDAVYELCDAPGATLRIQTLTAEGTPSPPEYYKHMLGWNHKALKVTVPIRSGDELIRAMDRFFEISARHVVP